jgi:hypothetical protein
MKNIKTEGGIFSQLSSSKRALLFYCICIWIRLSIALFVYKYSNNNKKFIYIIILAALLGIYLNFNQLNNKVWWNRYIHGINSLLLLIVCILSLIGYINSKLIGIILFWDVLFGILYSFYIKPFNQKI